ncbi:MAG: ketol-acid reductoisomerase [Deltaproteobacteria bacterium RIFCSPHIGHO2_12_FULL_43_9]|nr:MAG: ketol-acid reductoisomerase [Deltaproteobacteria bacterium RIFCSPHIGHO2_12_FULL_43_9]
MKIFRDSDIKNNPLKDKQIVILGYGSQGSAQALNLRDSGFKVIVGLRKGSQRIKDVERERLKFLPMAEAVKKADLIAMLTPDETHASIYNEFIKTNFKQNGVLLFAHGANIYFKTLLPRRDMDVVMVAPKSPGPILRQRYLDGSGVPAIYSIHQDKSGHAKDIALCYAKGLGCGRSGIIEATFEEETKTDLFGEQAVLCGGLIELMKASYEELIKRGLPPELAYYECSHEVKFIADLLHTKGFAAFANSVSNTALYGGLKQGPRIIDEKVKKTISKIYDEIEDGTFAKEWFESNGSKNAWLDKKRKELINHSIEKAGKTIRELGK